MYGTIPPGIGRLVNLTYLDLSRNQLSGSIPESIGQLGRLHGLHLDGNNLSGSIPISLGELNQLNDLNLSMNMLQGQIPPSVGNFQSLNSLVLSNNLLNGSIPKELFTISSLSQVLDLSNNLFSGLLPLEVGQLQNLGKLVLSGNRLAGPIPATIGDCQVLEQLYISGNFLEGSIPSSLGNLKALTMLDLSRNNFSGPFPEFLVDLANLQLVNLSFNDLSGQVPKEGVFNNASAILVVGNGNLCGGIPGLHLPPCPIHGSENGDNKKSIVLKVVIPVICGVLSLTVLVTLLIICHYKRSSKIKKPDSFLDDLHKKVSYGELHNATDGFSSSNLIGFGAFSSVYKGFIRDGEIETTVAVKVLNLQRRGALRTFVAECEALRNIRHRNLVKVITVCAGMDRAGNDFRALVLEFMPNGSLDSWLHPQPNDAEGACQRCLSLFQRLNIAVNVAAALDYLHNRCGKHVVHCDLKPTNVLLDDNMTAHVGDFGLASFLDGRSHAASSIAIKGSIGYVAPEYGMGGHISTSGDVYSYGILLLELFTGKRPTDEMFKDGMNIQKFVEAEISRGIHVSIFADRTIFCEGVEEHETDKIAQCVASVLKIGLSCARESPAERMDMEEVSN